MVQTDKRVERSMVFGNTIYSYGVLIRLMDLEGLDTGGFILEGLCRIY